MQQQPSYGECTRCGETVTYPNGRMLCWQCLATDFAIPGQPLHLHCVRIPGSKFGSQWQRYAVVFLCTFSPQIEGDHVDIDLLVRVAQAFTPHGDGYAYAEIYRPPHGMAYESINLVGYSPEDRDEAIRRATRGFKLLVAIENNRGRPFLSEQLQEYQRQLTLKATTLKRDYPSLAWDHVAARVGVSPATLKTWRRKYR